MSTCPIPGHTFMLKSGVLLDKEERIALYCNQTYLGISSLENSSLRGSQREHFEVVQTQLLSAAAENTLSR